MNLRETAAHLVSEVITLTVAVRDLIEVLNQVKDELEWANNRGPSYTITETISEGPDDDEALCK